VRCLQDHPHQPGAPRLRALLGELTGAGPADLRSELEVRLLQLCDDHGLPRPVVNAQVAGVLSDFFWADAALVVETDGYAHHRTLGAFERDRERDQRLTLAGYTVVRFSARQVQRRPEAVASTIRRLLHQRRGSPGARGSCTS
jgi:very-short-patch-repair endonuclease